METFLQDVRYAVRVFVRNPAFTAVAVLVLALGIGANSAIFSVIHAVLLKPLPFREPGRLIQVHGSQTQLPILPVSVADYLDWKARTKLFENISCFVGYGALNYSGGEPEARHRQEHELSEPHRTTQTGRHPGKSTGRNEFDRAANAERISGNEYG